MQDMHDGTVIKNLMSPGFLSVAENTGLVISTDGVPIYKSSKGSLWPIYLMVTSIAPHLHSKIDNLIVASLWFGPTKPDMTRMMQPVPEKIFLNSRGIEVESGTYRKVYLRAKLIMGVFDLPARASATNTKQYNGKYGCFYCLDKGVYQNRARIYPPNDSHTLRTTEQMRQWALTAQSTNVPQMVSSVSLSYLDFLNFLSVFL